MRYGAVIVAAGRSKRMKPFKQLMNIGEMSIAERVIINFLRAGIKNIVMVTGDKADQFEKGLKGFGIEFIRNEQYETAQMFDSARLGLEYMQDRCDRVFFCPVDVPFFTDKTLTAEMEKMDSDSRIKVIVPGFNGRGGHPLLIDGAAISEILTYRGDKGMKGAYEALPPGTVVRIEVGDEGAVKYADTKENFRKLVDIHNEHILHPEIRVTIATTTRFFGPGTVSLLKEIDRCGNVREACERCGFSYSKGWTILRRCEERFGWTIVDRHPGGQTGGSASVTDKGHDLLSVYEELESELTSIAEEKFSVLMKKYKLTGDDTGEPGDK